MQKVIKTLNSSSPSRLFSFCYAGLLVLMAVSQLFKFDEFIDLISKNSGVGGEVAFILAAMIVIFEVFSIPYLVDLKMLKQVRLISLICVLMSGMFWIIMAFSMGLVSPVDDVGFFGTIITIKSGFEAIVLSLIIASSSIYACRKFLFVVKK